MRILYVINSLGKGGAENLIYNIVKNDNKNQTDILILTDNDNVYDVSNFDNVKLYISPYKSLKDLRHIKFIEKVINFGEYDIVHANLFPSFYYVALAKTRKHKNVKFVYTEHSTSNRRRRNKVFRLLDNYMYNKYDSIISISDGVFNSLNRWLSKKNIKKNVIIYNGIDIDKFKNAKGYKKKDLSKKFDDNNIVILMTARFSPQKDQNTIIRSLTKLPKKYVAVFAGDGELLEKSKDLVKELKLEERVEFLGFRRDIPEITKTADIIVVSSVVEGFGLVAVEGMAAEKVVIGTDIEGLRDIINKEENLFALGDFKALARKILDYESGKYDGTLESYLEKYNINTMIDGYNTLYNNYRIKRSDKI